MSALPRDDQAPTPHPTADPAAIGAFWDTLTEHDQVYELRILRTDTSPTGKKLIDSAFVTQRQPFIDIASRITGAYASGAYLTMNPVDPSWPAALGRPLNRLARAVGKTTIDPKISRRCIFLIDVDAANPTGMSATAAERAAALATRDEIEAWLQGEGWPSPRVKTSSGNGGGLLYKIDLPNDEAARQLIKRALEALHARFTTPAATVDIANSNAARITRIPGTVTAKGSPTPERPWRQATAVYPAGVGIVTRAQLDALAALAPRTTRAISPRASASDARATTRVADADGESYADLLTNGSTHGHRHHDMTRLVGHYLKCGLSTREIAILLRPWVDRCQPSFPYHELDDVIRDLAAAEARKDTRETDTRRPAPEDTAPIAGITPAPDGSGLITIDPRLLAWLVSQTAATTELRLRYNYILAVARDRALNDGQKLTEIVLSSHLPAHRSAATAEPVTVAASTIARELGSKVTIQKDGKPRPTKLSTVTKNLADIITLGVRKRDEVISERVITNPRKRDKNGHPLQETIKVTNYAYHSGGSLPGERMDREQALAAETRAKVDRTRPRCSNCYSDKLKPTSHVCLKCGKVSSDVDAMRAGHELVDLGDGRFVHRDTGESIVPGVPVEVIDTHDWNPVMGSANGKEGVLKDAQDIHDWNPVTIEPCEGGDRNPVMAPMLFMTALSNDKQPSSLSSPLPHPAWPDHWRLCPGGCGIPQPHGSTCKACRIRQDSMPLHIPGSTPTHDGGAS